MKQRIDLRLDYYKKDARLIILHRLELDLISDQDPKTLDAHLGIIRLELGFILIIQTRKKTFYLCDGVSP